MSKYVVNDDLLDEVIKCLRRTGEPYDEHLAEALECSIQANEDCFTRYEELKFRMERLEK